LIHCVAQLCYNEFVREVLFTKDAVRQFKRLPKPIRPLIKDAIRLHLIEADPSEVTRNRFRLRRPSEHADYELRADNWRIFYRIDQDRVIITLLGEKVGSRLIFEGEDIRL
jgi:mRNA-degrading endonuclease RelE of RelBE toxin-antitoxin system